VQRLHAIAVAELGKSLSVVGELCCTALGYAHDVAVGLEFPVAESSAVETFLNSEGECCLRCDLDLCLGG
jgi:hypothetical protein